MREQCRGMEDGPRGDVYAERLDNRLHVFECVPNRIGVEGIAGYRLQLRILDRYACRRTRQRANAMTSEKRGLHRFESDASARAYDENFRRGQLPF